MTTKILCIDDEPNILAGYQRSLRKQFEIEIATGGAQALIKIAQTGPYAVLVTDMRMPGMNGVEFLKQARAASPNTVRIMLTGNADQQTAAEAVNQGHVFRFLTKPCSPETLVEALTAALEHHRILAAEKQLLEKTLGGAVKMLVEILSTTNPDLFGRAQALRKNMRVLAATMLDRGALTAEENDWSLELGALLARLGAVTIPPTITYKVHHHIPLTEAEKRIWQRVPESGYHLLNNIPRLESVAEIVRHQSRCYTSSESPSGEQIPMGARMLKVLLDLAEIESGSVSRCGAFKFMQRHLDRYDPIVYKIARECLTAVPPDGSEIPTVSLHLRDLKHGHVLAGDVLTKDGKILLSSGRRLTEMLIEKINNHADLTGIEEPILVRAGT